MKFRCVQTYHDSGIYFLIFLSFTIVLKIFIEKKKLSSLSAFVLRIMLDYVTTPLHVFIFLEASYALGNKRIGSNRVEVMLCPTNQGS